MNVNIQIALGHDCMKNQNAQNKIRGPSAWKANDKGTQRSETKTKKTKHGGKRHFQRVRGQFSGTHQCKHAFNQCVVTFCRNTVVAGRSVLVPLVQWTNSCFVRQQYVAGQMQQKGQLIATRQRFVAEWVVGLVGRRSGGSGRGSTRHGSIVKCVVFPYNGTDK